MICKEYSRKCQPCPACRGSYILVCHCQAHGQVQIGRLGTLKMQDGWYLYTGSAFGPGGIAARVGRHLKMDKVQRWHIDYLRPHLEIREIWFSQEARFLEHEWAQYWSTEVETRVVMARFGASDCRCPAHLFYRRSRPNWRVFHQDMSNGRIKLERIVIK